jgi:hypothetical protein
MAGATDTAAAAIAAVMPAGAIAATTVAVTADTPLPAAVGSTAARADSMAALLGVASTVVAAVEDSTAVAAVEDSTAAAADIAKRI